MLKKLRHTRGEMMIEVLVALTIIVFGAFAAVKMIGLALLDANSAKQRMLATNLAREGIEAVRIVRDTNWLRYGGERRKCWNNASATDCDVLGGIDYIDHETPFTVDFSSSNYRWSMDNQAARLDFSAGADPVYRLFINQNGLYTHSDTDAESTPYFREIYAEYVGDDGRSAPPSSRIGSSCSGITECANALRVTSKVVWIDSSRGRVSDVALTTVLTDYLGRSDHN